MNNIYKSKMSDKATVCAGKVCATVEGETAKAVNAIVIVAVLFMAIGLIVKTVK